MKGDVQCELCEREVNEVTKHHLIPRTRHANKRNKKQFDRKEVKERIAWLCRPCHKQIHAVFTEKQLERDFNTLPSIKAHPEIGKFVDWLKDKPAGLRVVARGAKRKAGS
jgi:hypothetical protein